MLIDVLSRTTRGIAGACVLMAGLTGPQLLEAQDGSGAPAAGSDNGGGAIHLERLVPADTFAFASFAGLDACSRTATELGLYKLWQEEEVQDFLKSLVGQLNGFAEQAPAQAKQQWEMAKALLSGRISVAFTGLTMIYLNDEPGFFPMPAIVASLELGPRRQMCEQLIDSLLAENMDTRPLRFFERDAMEYRGHKVQVLRSKRLDPGFSVCWTFAGDSLIATLNPRAMKKALDRLAGHADGPSLAQNPRLAKARAKTGATALTEIFVDVPAITSRIRGLIPDEMRDVIHKLGLDGINGAYLVSGVRGDQGFEGMFVDAAAPRRGWLKAVEAPVGKAELSRIPDTAAVVLASRDNIAEVYDLVWSSMADLIPPSEFALILRDRSRLEQEMGLTIREDIIGALEGAWVAYAEAPRNGFIPNVVLSVGIADRAKAERAMGVLLASIGLESRQLEYGGNTMTVVELRGDAPVSPSYAFIDDHLVIASTPVGLKKLIRAQKKPQRKSILDNPQFQAAMQGLQPEQASGLAFVDTKRVAALGYNFAETMLPGMVDADELPVDLAMMPSSDVVLAHLKPWAIATRFDQDGALCVGRLDGTGTALALIGRVVLESPGVLPYAIGRMAGSFGRGGRGARSTAYPPARSGRRER